MQKSEKQTKKRVVVVLVLFSILFFALFIRAFYIQIVQGKLHQREALTVYTSTQIINPNRGIIYDRNEKIFALNEPVETISIDPKVFETSASTINQVAKSLSEILDISQTDILNKLNKKSSVYEILKKKVQKDISDKVRSLINTDKITGIYFASDVKRDYPNDKLAAQIIGFTGMDNQGLTGIEASMDQYLKGTPGKTTHVIDPNGTEIPFGDQKDIQAQDGANVVLTIDETIQNIADNALQKAMKHYKVLGGGTAIVMDPRNGDILAMVSKPDFNLNSPFSVPESTWRNMAVEDTYEPGSTFKSITAAAGLEENIISPDSAVVCSPVRVSGNTINCWQNGGHGKETFAQALNSSCNPVFVKLSQQIGINRFYNYVKGFGFYDKTGIELPDEGNSLMHANPTQIDMATCSFGQSFTVTPLQIITAYAAIANGGNLMMPRLVQELTDSEGNIIKKFEPQVVRKVISKRTSNTLKKMLADVVSKGTGYRAKIKGYKVAGKTGTSQTFDKNGKRSKDKFIASFASIAPIDNPVICVLVVLNNPSKHSHEGGVVATPVAGSIINDTLTYLGVEKTFAGTNKNK